MKKRKLLPLFLSLGLVLASCSNEDSTSQNSSTESSANPSNSSENSPQIQPDLTVEESPEEVSAPEGVTLPAEIQVLGDSRFLSLEQASAYANYLSDTQTTHVAFVDSGDNTVVMIGGKLDEYQLYAPDGMPGGTEMRMISTVVGWNGSEIVTTEYISQQYEKYFVKQNDSVFYLQIDDATMDTGI